MTEICLGFFFRQIRSLQICHLIFDGFYKVTQQVYHYYYKFLKKINENLNYEFFPFLASKTL